MKTNYITNYNCGVYKITNLINGKCYVGQSIKLKDRLATHRRHKEDSLFHKAIRKYGIENFHFEIIIYCDRQDLNLYENLFILTFNTRSPNGYNLSMDGSYAYPVADETRKKFSDRMSNNHPMSRKVIDITGRIWENVTKCSEELQVHNSHLSSMIRGKRLWYKHLKPLDLHYLEDHPEDYKFITKEELDLITPKYVKRNKLKEIIIIEPGKCGGGNPGSKKVIGINDKIWNSLIECATELNVNRKNLGCMLNGKIPMLKRIVDLELKWFSDCKYKENEPKELIQSKRKIKNRAHSQDYAKARKVIDVNGRVWEAIKDCAKDLNISENELSKFLKGRINEPVKLIGLNLKYLT